MVVVVTVIKEVVQH